MKHILIANLVLLTSLIYGQKIDFSAYSEISNQNFKSFINTFSAIELPLSTKDFIELSLSDKNYLDKHYEDSFLKESGKYVMPSLNTRKNENGFRTEVYGDFVPLYKLPTSGDYVLLVIHQFDVAYETSYKTWVLTFDLHGNFINKIGSGFIFSGADNYVNCSINRELEFTDTYLLDIGKSVIDYIKCRPCSKESKTEVYMLDKMGQSMLHSTMKNEVAYYRYKHFHFEAKEQ